MREAGLEKLKAVKRDLKLVNKLYETGLGGRGCGQRKASGMVRATCLGMHVQ